MSSSNSEAWLDAGGKKFVPGAGASHVQEMSLRVVHPLQVGLIADLLDGACRSS